MKKVLFIGHSYHRKTKSADFFLDIIKTKYDFETFYFDPYNDDYIKFNDLNGLEFDIIILWQISPDIEKLTSYVKAKQIVFFPMYDGVAGKSFNFWYSYRNVKIINFSKTLHEKLKKWGLDTHYIQYFPKPADKQIFGNEKQIYFWQRIQKINIKIVEQLFSKIGFDGIHLHKALDPTHEFIEPSNRIKDKIEYSTWYDKKEDMLKDIQKAGIYIAPRHLEGIGMSFLEAMAMGKCVVAPNLPTMNEYIKHNETGILYDLKNPKPLNEFDGKSLGEKSYNYIKQGYAIWEKEKFNMLDWMEEPVLIDNKKLKKQNLKIIRYKLFNFLPILTIKSRINKIKILLFGCVPFIIIKKNEFRFFYICLFKKVDRKKDFLLTFLWKYIASLNCKRNIVLILDNLHESEANISDNFCFFEYLCKQKSTSLSPYYLISKESPYCCSLKEKYGKRVLVYDKKRALFFKFYFTFLLFRLKYICESFKCLQIVNSNLYRIIKKSKYIFSIFTQHGITYFKPDFITPDSYGFNKFD